MMTESPVEWVEIIEPKSQRPMYGNLRTGELAWHAPMSSSVKKRDNNQWWELFDPNTSRFYYYNEMLQQTVWHRPQNCDIIPLAKLQTLKLNTEARSDDSETAKLRSNQGHRHKHHHKHHHHHRHHHGNQKSSEDLSSPARDNRQHRRRGSEQLERQQMNDPSGSIQHGRSIHQLPAHSVAPPFNSTGRTQRAPLQPIDTSQRSFSQIQNQSYHGRSRSESAPMEYLGGVVPDPKVRKLSENDPRQQGVGHDQEKMDMGQETYVTSTASNVSQSSDHSELFLMERSESRSSQGSHHSREGFGTHPRAPSSERVVGGPAKAPNSRRDDKSPSRTHGGSGRQPTSPKVKKKMPKMGVRAAIRQHQTQQPVSQGVPPGHVPGYPVVSSSGLVHSHSGDHFSSPFYPGHHPSHLMVQPGDQNHHLRVRQGEHPPLVQSMSYHGRPTQRTTTPDSLSSQESYPASQPMLVPYAVTTITAPEAHTQPTHAQPAHKHSDSQLSQSSQVSYASQQSLSSQHSDSSARPVTSDSHSHVSQSSEDVSFNSDMRHASLDSGSGVGYVAANVHAIANASLSPEPAAPGALPQGGAPQDLSGGIYMNTDFLHQREKEREHRQKLRELDQRDAERSGSPTLALHLRQRPAPGQAGNGSQDEKTLEEDSEQDQVSQIEALLNHSFDTEGTEESSRETSTNVDTSSPMHTPGSPLSPGSNQGITTPPNFFHASLQRNHKSDQDAPSPAGGAPPIMERSVSVQEQRPSSAKHGTIPSSMKTSPSLTVMVQPKKPSSSESDLENYAAENLNRHKKGLLRKKVSLSNMLSWTKEPIKKPMLITGDKAVKKEAVETFKLVQAYMGDRVIRGATKDTVCLELITKGWSLVPLRDEIFMQLCRQTTDNYAEESLRAGWELLSIALNFFPPTQTFYTYLENYIKKHLDGEYDLRKVPVRDYAEYCTKRLERCSKLGARKGAKNISNEEILQAKESIFSPSMFGEMLQDVMSLQRKRFPDRKLPWIVVALTEEILRLGAEKTEGIFRVPGDIDEVNALKIRCDQWLPLECNDPHVPASLLKFWYRDLYQPLIPMEFYDRCIDHCENIDEAQQVIDELPELNRLTLSHFIRFLQGFVKEDTVSTTKMDVSNLAMVMAPDILRCDSENPHIIFENTRKEMSFLRTLILHQDTDFMEGVI